MGVDELSQGGAVRDTDGDGIAEILQDIDGQGNDITNLNLLSTETASVTKQTVVRADNNTSLSVSANTWVAVPMDLEREDRNNEYDNTNYQFTPSTSGIHEIYANVAFRPGSSGDEVDVRFQNVTQSITPGQGQARYQFAGTSVHNHPLLVRWSLNAGDTYELQLRNRDSSGSFNGSRLSHYVIKRVIQ